MAFDLSTAKPAGGGFDLATAKPVAAPAASTAKQELLSSGIAPLDSAVGTAEAALNLGSGMLTKPASDIAGLAAIPLHAAGAIKTDPAQVKQSIQDLTYQPKTAAGQEIAEKNPIALVGKALGWGGRTARNLIDPARGEGGLRAAAGQAVEEGIQQIPALLGGRGSVPKAAKPTEVPLPKSTGAGAEAVVNEMQRQREAGNAPTRGEVGMSARESAKLDLDEATKPMREAAFASPVKVSMAEPLSLIDRMKSQTNNPNVVKALDKAKSIIEDGINKSKPKAPESGRMTAAEYKALKEQGSAGTMPAKMLDETRQAINDVINGIGESENFGPFAKKELMAIQESMLKYAPKEYQAYLAEYVKRAQGLEQFKAPGGAMEKVTTDPAAFDSLNRVDKQNLINKALEGDTPGRTLTELVRDTEHSPQAAAGVREAYTDWLTQSDPVSKLPTARGLTSRWEKTREAVKSSKLMTEEHISAMDKIMDDVRQAEGASALKKAWASTAGFMMGQTVGHPIVGAHAARDLLVGSKGEVTRKAMEGAVMKIASDPNGAAALAAPPTPANIAAVRQMMPKDIAAIMVTGEAQQEQQKPMRAKRLLSMQPMGF